MYTRNTHAQWISCQVYASLTQPAQLCARMSINNIPDCDGHVHHENRSLIQSLVLMRSAISHHGGKRGLEKVHGVSDYIIGS